MGLTARPTRTRGKRRTSIYHRGRAPVGVNVRHPDRITSHHGRDMSMESIPKSILVGRVLMTLGRAS